MNRKIAFLSALSSFLLLISCKSDLEKEKTAQIKIKKTTKTYFEFTNNLRVDQKKGYKVLNIITSWTGTQDTLKYALIPKTQEKKVFFEEKLPIIQVPINRFATTSTSILPYFELLNITSRLKGLTNPDLITSPILRQKISEDQIQNIGDEKGLNVEKLLALEPEVLIDYGSQTNYDRKSQFESKGISVLLLSDFLEPSLLARAEYVKLIGLLSEQEKLATEVFEQIKNQTLKIAEMGSTAQQGKTKKPTVMLNLMYGDTWYVPQRKNVNATMIAKAGGKYIFNDLEGTGSSPLGYEKVFLKASTADIWLNVPTINSLDALKAQDERYAEFAPFRNKKIYCYKKGNGLGSYYFEYGFARPDWVMHDLVKIINPGAFSSDSLYFYKRLQ